MPIKRYIERGIEESLLQGLTVKKSVALIGFSGVGKTSLLKNLSQKLIKKGYIPILVKTSVDSKSKPYINLDTFPDELGAFHLVPELIVPSKYLYPADEFYSIVSKFGGSVEKKLREIDKESSIDEVIAKMDLGKSLRENVRRFGKVDKLMITSSSIISTLLHNPLISAFLISVTICDLLWNAFDPDGDPGKSKRLKEVLLESNNEMSNGSKIVLLFDDLNSPLKSQNLITLMNIDLIESALHHFSSLFSVSLDEDDTIDYLTDKSKWISWVPGVHSESDIYTLYPPNIDELGLILEANIDNTDDLKLSRVLTIADEPALALMMYNMDLSETEIQRLVEEMKNSRYTGFEKLEGLSDKRTRDDLVRDNFMRKYRISAILYNKIRKRNFATCAILTQPFGLTVDNLQAFCNMTRRYRDNNGLRCNADFSGEDANFVSLINERTGGMKQEDLEFYTLNDLWRHLARRIEYISSKGFELKQKETKHISKEIAIIRRNLIEILDSDGRRSVYFREWQSFPILYHSQLLYEYYIGQGGSSKISLGWLVEKIVFWLPVEVQFHSPFSASFVKLMWEASSRSLVSPILKAHMISSQMLAVQGLLSMGFYDSLWESVTRLLELIEPESEDKGIRYVSYLALAFLVFKLYGTADVDLMRDLLNDSNRAMILIEQEGGLCAEFTKAKLFTLVGYTIQRNHLYDQLTLRILREALKIQDAILQHVEIYARDPIVEQYLIFPYYTTKVELVVSLSVLNDKILALNALGLIENLNDDYSAGQMHISSVWSLLDNFEVGKHDINIEHSKLDFLDFEVVHNGLRQTEYNFLNKLFSDILERYGDYVPIHTLEAILMRLAFAKGVLEGLPADSYISLFDHESALKTIFMGASYINETLNNKAHTFDKEIITAQLTTLVQYESNRIETPGDRLIFTRVILDLIKNDFASAIIGCKSANNLHPLTSNLFSKFASQLTEEKLTSSSFDTFVRLYFLTN
jgi:hypothetical protein